MKTCSRAMMVLMMLLIVLPIKAQASSFSVYRSEYTYSFRCRGACDIKVSTDSSTSVYLYQQRILTRGLLLSRRRVGSLFYRTGCSGYNTYYLYVKTDNKKNTRMRISIEQHLDRNNSYSGGIWKPNRSSPVSDVNLLYLNKYYFTREQCLQALNYASQKKYLDWQSKLVNGSVSIGSMIAGGCGIKAASVASAFLSIAQLGYSVDFKKYTLSKIRRLGGYSSVTNRFTRGVVLTEYRSRGIPFIDVSSWNGPVMTGVPGYVGSWYSR